MDFIATQEQPVMVAQPQDNEFVLRTLPDDIIVRQSEENEFIR